MPTPKANKSEDGDNLIVPEEKSTPTALDDKRKLAIAECEGRIAWYSGSKNRSRRTFLACTSVIMVCGSLTPLFLLVNDSLEAGKRTWKIPSFIVATPAAIAAITSGYQAIFNPRRRWTQCAYLEQSLRFELMDFKLACSQRYGSMGDDKSIEKFFSRIKRLVLDDVRNWGDLLRDPPQAGKDDD